MKEASVTQVPARRSISAAMKVIFAASGLAVCMAGFGGFAGVAPAYAAPDTGTYDDQLNLEMESCWGSVPLPGARAWEVGNPESAGCAHKRN
jgi:hypothetical protein